MSEGSEKPTEAEDLNRAGWTETERSVWQVSRGSREKEGRGRAGINSNARLWINIKPPASGRLCVHVL